MCVCVRGLVFKSPVEHIFMIVDDLELRFALQCAILESSFLGSVVEVTYLKITAK